MHARVLKGYLFPRPFSFHGSRLWTLSSQFSNPPTSARPRAIHATKRDGAASYDLLMAAVRLFSARWLFLAVAAVGCLLLRTAEAGPWEGNEWALSTVAGASCDAVCRNATGTPCSPAGFRDVTDEATFLIAARAAGSPALTCSQTASRVDNPLYDFAPGYVHLGPGQICYYMSSAPASCSASGARLNSVIYRLCPCEQGRNRQLAHSDVTVAVGQPTRQPTGQPTRQTTTQPSVQPTSRPTSPTGQPSSNPSVAPTLALPIVSGGTEVFYYYHADGACRSSSVYKIALNSNVTSGGSLNSCQWSAVQKSYVLYQCGINYNKFNKNKASYDVVMKYYSDSACATKPTSTRVLDNGSVCSKVRRVGGLGGADLVGGGYRSVHCNVPSIFEATRPYTYVLTTLYADSSCGRIGGPGVQTATILNVCAPVYDAAGSGAVLYYRKLTWLSGVKSADLDVDTVVEMQEDQYEAPDNLCQTTPTTTVKRRYASNLIDKHGPPHCFRDPSNPDLFYKHVYGDHSVTLDSPRMPSPQPSAAPTAQPTRPTAVPSALPTQPTALPTCPSAAPTATPTTAPSPKPSSLPTATPTRPTAVPSALPTILPTPTQPTALPTCPSAAPTATPSTAPSPGPTFSPTSVATVLWANGVSSTGSSNAIYDNKGAYSLLFDTSGSLRWRNPAGLTVWAIISGGSFYGAAGGGQQLIVQGDGNVVIYNANGVRWSSRTASSDPTLGFYTDDNGALWIGTYFSKPNTYFEWTYGGVNGGNPAVRPGIILYTPGENIPSPLIMMESVMCILSLDNTVWWAPGGAQIQYTFQPDGNFVYYTGSASLQTGTGVTVSTSGTGPSLCLQSDGNLVIYDTFSTPGGSTGTATWASGTATVGSTDTYYLLMDSAGCVFVSTSTTDAWKTSKQVKQPTGATCVGGN